MNIRSVFLISLFIAPMFGVAQVTLRPWVQVFGTTPGQALGRFVNGITPSANLPYKASISSFGNTGLYTLQNPNDTGAQRFFFGSNMQTGDLNGDGWKDIVISRSGGTTFVDTVVIFWGTSTSIDTVLPTKLTGSNVRESFGFSTCLGNLVGDSIPDLVVGAPDFPTAGVSQGRVYIYRGGTPFDTTPSVVLRGDTARYLLGRSLAVGDLNNDGYNDLVARGLHATTPRFDYVSTYFGSSIFDTTMDLRIFSVENNSRGLACFDTNGDGISDLLWTNRDSLDWVYVHYGGVNFSATPSLRLRDPQFAVFGTSIINAGDMNGDGFNDIAVAAPFSITSGFVFVYGGGPRIDPRFDGAVGMSSDSEFGSAISSVGDVNGDGLADIIVGAPNFEFGNDKGYWGVFKGDTLITVTSIIEGHVLPTVFALRQSYPNPFNPRTTIEYDLSESAEITLEVFDMLGRQVALLAEGFQRPGTYQESFDATHAASGIYFYRLTVTTQRGYTYADTKKIILIR